MISDWEMCYRLLLAALYGSLIGIQREHLFWTAGLRTHMLVCAGACLIMIVSAFGFSLALTQPGTQLDPSRIAAQVVSGIGFLGAGSIMMRGEIIKGLTTAASLWAVAGIGLAVGGGLYMLGAVATFLILIILIAIRPVERMLRDIIQIQVVKLIAPNNTLSPNQLKQLLGERADKIRQFIVERGPDSSSETFTIELRGVTKAQSDEIVKQILGVDGVREVAPPH